jgi:hypothetical protein
MPDSASGVGRLEKPRRREPGPLASPRLGDARWLPESAPTVATRTNARPTGRDHGLAQHRSRWRDGSRAEQATADDQQPAKVGQ